MAALRSAFHDCETIWQLINGMTERHGGSATVWRNQDAIAIAGDTRWTTQESSIC
jgi:hypothetical protein